jgi:dTDP-4-amino-4,6-dideoxygalactose transaminase
MMSDTARNRVEPPIPFIDLGAQRHRLGSRIDDAVLRVLDHGNYIMGPEIGALEAALSDFCGAGRSISCSNGTDALALALMVKKVRPGQAVLVPSFTFAATAEVVAWFGATALFVDVLEDCFTMDPASLEAGVAAARRLGLDPVGVIPVDLFGQPADYDALHTVAAAHKLWVVSDAAQSFGARYQGRPVGTLAEISTTSFFPAKPLGCYGDGGAVFTDCDDISSEIVSLRVHGQGGNKYDNIRIGRNARLDTIQAAILIEKLKIYPDEILARNRIAGRYNEGLSRYAVVPNLRQGTGSVWAQYTLRVDGGRRNAMAASLKRAGVPTAIYYPKPLHCQTAYRNYPTATGGALPVSEILADEVISLPMHAYLDEPTQDRIIAAVQAILT